MMRPVRARFWRLIHHCIAHPLMAFSEAMWLTRFHDWTGQRMEQDQEGGAAISAAEARAVAAEGEAVRKTLTIGIHKARAERYRKALQEIATLLGAHGQPLGPDEEPDCCIKCHTSITLTEGADAEFAWLCDPCCAEVADDVNRVALAALKEET